MPTGLCILKFSSGRNNVGWDSYPVRFHPSQRWNGRDGSPILLFLGAYFGGGRVVGVLSWRSANSTRTLFLYRERRVESGGYEFNSKVRGGYSERGNDEVRMTNGEVKDLFERIL